MQILTYPVGVVIGLLPVVVELGVPPRPAQLLVDGRTACAFSSLATRCDVDLGKSPRVHLLELVRTGDRGQVVERAVRWVNRPGSAGAEVQTRTRCDENGARCAVTIGWAHSERLDPKSVVVALDGRRVAAARNRALSLNVEGTRGALLTVELTFPDGRRATHASVLGSRTHGDEDAVISARMTPGACGAEGLRKAGLTDAGVTEGGVAGVRVRAAERGEGEIVFVAEPAAYGRLVAMLGAPHEVQKPPERRALEEFLKGTILTHIVVPDRRLARAEIPRRESFVDDLLETLDATPLRPVRLADAVASAALYVGVPGKRRVVVLLLGDGAEDTSVLPADGVRAYLEEIQVPLAVWRTRAGVRPEWPGGRVLESVSDVHEALAEMRAHLDCQAIVWSEAEAP